MARESSAPRSALNSQRTACYLTSVPGMLSAALGIEPRHNCRRILRRPLVITRGRRYGDDEIFNAPRIGVTKAQDSALWWYVAGSEYVSVLQRVDGRRSN